MRLGRQWTLALIAMAELGLFMFVFGLMASSGLWVYAVAGLVLVSNLGYLYELAKRDIALTNREVEES